MWRNLVKLRTEQPAECKRCGNSNAQSDYNGHQPLDENESQHIHGLRPECDPHTDFPCALRDAVSDGAVNADRGQEQRDSSKEPE